MKIIFYSEKCEYCKKILDYLDKYNIKHMFDLIDINNNNIPKDIDIVPTIIDSELNQPLKGKKAFEYLINIKYFNNPTNNIDYIKSLPANPDIKEDDKADTQKNINLEIITNNVSNKTNLNDFFKVNESISFYEVNKDKDISKISNEMIQSRQQQDKKLSILLRMKKN